LSSVATPSYTDALSNAWARAAVLTSLSLSAIATTSPVRAERSHELRVSKGPETVYTLSATALWLGIEAARPLWAPVECRWCNPPALDAKVRAALKADEPLGANLASYGTALLSPVVAFGGLGIAGSQHGGGTFGTDALIVGESVATMVVTNLFKGAFARERPFAHALSPEEKRTRDGASDHNLSFFSGHVSFTFSMAAASGTVASLRGYDLAPYIWGVGFTLATATSYLRIVSDSHYFTDVVAGALVGTALGVGMPLLFHGRTGGERRVVLSPLPLSGVQGIAISGVF
jgi:membrane-associated phospholipid phosphatase